VELYERPSSGEAPGDQPVELGRYFRALRRNSLLIALIVVPLTALVLVFSLLVSKTYRATARVVLSDTGLVQAADATTMQRELATIRVLATTPSVLTRAAAHLRGESVRTLEKNVTASVDPDANIISISATDRDPRSAAAAANAVAQAYIDLRSSAEQAQLKRDRANLLQLMENVRNAPNGAAQSAAVQDRLNQISVQQASAGSDLDLAQPARPPSAPYSPRPVRNAVFAFFAAVLLAILAALAREHFVRRLDGPRELSRLLLMPILSSVPLTRRARGRRRWHARGLELEAYEALGASFEFQLPAAEHQRSILVTSAVSGEGRSEVSARLAQALADSGHSTLLVDADPRYPTIHEFFGLPAGLGLGGLVRAVRSEGRNLHDVVDDALANAHLTDRLSVLTGGERAARPSRLLAGDGSEVAAILDELSHRPFDYVVIDGPPMLGVVDAQILARKVDAVLIAARLDRLTVENVHDLRELLDRHEIKPLGLFVTGAQATVSHYLLNGREVVLEDA
jgi:capsular exopolysaccharide synthesis family protein